MVKVGIVGWRGMVGSVMIARMLEESDFNNFDPFFFSTSKAGKTGPDINIKIGKVENAYNIQKLAKMDIIVSCQGSIYTKRIHKKLRSNNWRGYWIDAASELRMKKQSIIVLDPLNKKNIEKALLEGVLDYVGGNCTVSLMLMALHGLFKNDWVKWITSMTYQAVSGAGSDKLREMLLQMQIIGNKAANLLADPSSSILDIDNQVIDEMNKHQFPPINLGMPIAANLIPWIDSKMRNGQTKEEWKGLAETNKILGLTGKKSIRVDGQCVRIDTIRCHSQALTIKLRHRIPIKEIQNAIRTSNKWVKLIDNNEEATICNLNPAAVSGTLNIPVGKLRRLNLGRKYITAFTVGDQLLWGAAEPIRRTLNIILEHVS